MFDSVDKDMYSIGCETAKEVGRPGFAIRGVHYGGIYHVGLSSQYWLREQCVWIKECFLGGMNLTNERADA